MELDLLQRGEHPHLLADYVQPELPLLVIRRRNSDDVGFVSPPRAAAVLLAGAADCEMATRSWVRAIETVARSFAEVRTVLSWLIGAAPAGR